MGTGTQNYFLNVPKRINDLPSPPVIPDGKCALQWFSSICNIAFLT